MRVLGHAVPPTHVVHSIRVDRSIRDNAAQSIEPQRAVVTSRRLKLKALQGHVDVLRFYRPVIGAGQTAGCPCRRRSVVA